MTYDLHDVPFSTFGSYISVSALTGRRAPDGKPGLWARSHHGGACPLFRITPIGGDAPTKVEASPTRVRLTASGGAIDLCVDGPRTLRLRGSGVGVALEAAHGSVTYAMDDTLMAINVRAAARRYQVECLAGRLSRDAWRDERSGEQTLAREIARRFCRLCATSGFAENFDARTGQPLCDRAYTWTASVFLLLAERLHDLVHTVADRY